MKSINKALEYCKKEHAERKAEHVGHISFLACAILEEADIKFKLGSYGTDGSLKGQDDSTFTFSYLNMGDSYAETLVFIDDEYRVTSWGDVVEASA